MQTRSRLRGSASDEGSPAATAEAGRVDELEQVCVQVFKVGSTINIDGPGGVKAFLQSICSAGGADLLEWGDLSAKGMKLRFLWTHAFNPTLTLEEVVSWKAKTGAGVGGDAKEGGAATAVRALHEMDASQLVDHLVGTLKAHKGVVAALKAHALTGEDFLLLETAEVEEACTIEEGKGPDRGQVRCVLRWISDAQAAKDRMGGRVQSAPAGSGVIARRMTAAVERGDYALVATLAAQRRDTSRPSLEEVEKKQMMEAIACGDYALIGRLAEAAANREQSDPQFVRRLAGLRSETEALDGAQRIREAKFDGRIAALGRSVDVLDNEFGGGRSHRVTGPVREVKQSIFPGAAAIAGPYERINDILAPIQLESKGKIDAGQRWRSQAQGAYRVHPYVACCVPYDIGEVNGLLEEVAFLLREGDLDTQVVARRMKYVEKITRLAAKRADVTRDAHVLGFLAVAGIHLALNCPLLFHKLLEPEVYDGALPASFLARCRAAAANRVKYDALVIRVAQALREARTTVHHEYHAHAVPAAARGGGGARQSGGGGVGTSASAAWVPWHARLTSSWHPQDAKPQFALTKILKGYIHRERAASRLPANLVLCDKCHLVHPVDSVCTLHQFPAFRAPWFNTMWSAATACTWPYSDFLGRGVEWSDPAETSEQVRG